MIKRKVQEVALRKLSEAIHLTRHFQNPQWRALEVRLGDRLPLALLRKDRYSPARDSARGSRRDERDDKDRDLDDKGRDSRRKDKGKDRGPMDLS